MYSPRSDYGDTRHPVPEKAAEDLGFQLPPRPPRKPCCMNYGDLKPYDVNRPSFLVDPHALMLFGTERRPHSQGKLFFDLTTALQKVSLQILGFRSEHIVLAAMY
jgi:hypothetical protein